MLFTDTITVYNHYKSPETKADKWSRHVLREVMWKPQVIKSVSSDGKVNMASIISITIPETPGYVSPMEYAKLRSDEMRDIWTLNPRNNLDVIVLGECSIEITDLKSFRGSVLDIGTIAEVKDNTNRCLNKHWGVICK